MSNFCSLLKTIIYRILLKSAYSLLKAEERFNVKKSEVTKFVCEINFI